MRAATNQSPIQRGKNHHKKTIPTQSRRSYRPLPFPGATATSHNLPSALWTLPPAPTHVPPGTVPHRSLPVPDSAPVPRACPARLSPSQTSKTETVAEPHSSRGEALGQHHPTQADLRLHPGDWTHNLKDMIITERRRRRSMCTICSSCDVSVTAHPDK